MRNHQRHNSLQAIGIALTISLLAACSGGSAIAPQAQLQGSARATTGKIPIALRSLDPHHFNTGASRDKVIHYSCPATGPIKYVSESYNHVIDVFAGKFAGQAPCGQLASGLGFPEGLYVDRKSHDLYVANSGLFNVLVFHRGQTRPYNKYVDPSKQYVGDVTVANDGTVIASNLDSFDGGEAGSISTWISGPHGGTFVGNYPMMNDVQGLNITAQNTGAIFFLTVDAITKHSDLWTTTCPAGLCGTQSQVEGVSFDNAVAMTSDSANDLVVVDSGTNEAEIFRLPNRTPKSFPVTGFILGVAVNELDHHLFVADANNLDGAEYHYSSGKLIGTVRTGTSPEGIAVDP